MASAGIFLFELRFLSHKVFLHPGVLDDIHGGNTVVPLSLTQLLEE